MPRQYSGRALCGTTHPNSPRLTLILHTGAEKLQMPESHAQILNAVERLFRGRVTSLLSATTILEEKGHEDAHITYSQGNLHWANTRNSISFPVWRDAAQVAACARHLSNLAFSRVGACSCWLLFLGRILAQSRAT